MGLSKVVLVLAIYEGRVETRQYNEKDIEELQFYL